MQKRVLVTTALAIALVGCQSTSEQSQTETTSTSSAYSSLATAALTGALSAWGQQGAANTDLAGQIQTATNVTSDQAIGGVGSLLALAQNSLGSSQNQELGSLIPGYDVLESTGLSKMITDSGAVESAFSALGMDPALVSSFAPLIINALQAQGASSALTSALSGIWR
ncbi:hypothetical protein VIOR3934_11827 [Vibrio orientalis CIP 102891 = ATCC 33934]|uniref:DUF2780 domain-containing protein n=1 Tax=Vibrio orientalis CIP 102891 = ATCC 33934 TaxID=675816 RepID=C9QCU5_VIBOR|nr:DUF2780 domain-containing protein [Vibrio orientalis]EEX94946.1 hypothetical protein VIA_000409 [Vibrio orientalis CIP 102891 = ATCC 33934]EGU51724.1 hypothetical protein VIOR3934_11827 [Vibrio orientalis CIP 102891 = ATCC 33934]